MRRTPGDARPHDRSGSARRRRRERLRRAGRIGWMVASIVVVQALVCGAALLPPAAVVYAAAADRESAVGRVLIISAAAVPAYILFALLLMLASGLATRALGWRTPPGLDARLADVEWPLLEWARYVSALHIVRLLAGSIFRGSPIWTAYLRLAGARLGARVYVNSLALSDYNLLECGDDVVIGDGVHLSGHTVERGTLKTAPVRIGRNVTIGIGSIIDIGVDIGDGCQVAALTFVPKHMRLEPGTTYGGIPARPLD
jgi:acetyltransferase-like isoleucine patch superfamily enzyme